MPTSDVLILGASDPTVADLRRRVVSAGMACPQSSVFDLASGLAQLVQRPSEEHPQLVFLCCDGPLEQDRAHVSQVRRLTPATLIAVGRMAEPQHALQLIRAGANDCVCDQAQWDEELSGLLGRLTSQQRGREGELISVIGASGGCGASTLALNLAAALVKRGMRAGLVDLVLRGGDLASMLNVKPQHTVADFCRPSAAIDAEMLQKAFASHASGVQLLASPPPLETCGLVHFESIERLLQLTRRMFDVMIADLEDIFHREQLAATANQPDDSVDAPSGIALHASRAKDVGALGTTRYLARARAIGRQSLRAKKKNSPTARWSMRWPVPLRITCPTTIPRRPAP
jgi:pilus assembly protein CpaE